MTLHALVNNQPKQIVEGFIGVNDMPRSIKAIYIGNEENKPVLCFKREDYNYVSFGDSIAAGHSINDDWAKTYGTESQYGGSNTETAIVPGCYTDLINQHLVSTYSVNRVKTKSFAHSGDKVEDLINILNTSYAIEALQQASFVTICIGANTVLGPALNQISSYISNGNPTLNSLAVDINKACDILRDNNHAYSMFGLFNRLYAINPNAKYIFTTIYNPYKYLHLDEDKEGFFGPILNTIPDMTISIEDWMGFDVPFVDLSFSLGDLIKDSLLQQDIIQLLFDRTNALGGSSGWVEGQVNNLNALLKSKISEYNKENLTIIETKAKFDTYPDRGKGNGGIEYNDLVNVEYTSGYDTWTMNWGALWNGQSAADYWGNLSWKYLSFTDARWSINPMDYVNFDIGGFAQELVTDIVTRVIIPDIDPHPEEAGQKVMSELFIQAIPT